MTLTCYQRKLEISRLLADAYRSLTSDEIRLIVVI